MQLAVDDLWWFEKGFLPQQVDELPADRAAWLKAVAEIVDESRAGQQAKAQADAEHEQRLADAKRKAGML